MSKLFGALALIATGVNGYVLWERLVAGQEPSNLLQLFGTLGLLVFGFLWVRSNKKKQKTSSGCSDCGCDHK